MKPDKALELMPRGFPTYSSRYLLGISETLSRVLESGRELLLWKKELQSQLETSDFVQEEKEESE